MDIKKITAQVLLREIVQRLVAVSYEVQEAQSIGFELLETQFGLTKTDCVLNVAVELSPEVDLESMLNRLQQQEPVQYITGKASFYDLTLKVNQYVLIPRPETEELVHLIIQQHRKQRPLKVLDIGTGSGCIPISLKKNLPHAELYGLDVSSEALEVAKENAVSTNVDVHFFKADILKDELLEWNDEFDVIVSNPPYVRESEKELMQANVLDYEPHLALFVTDTKPLVFYRRVAGLGLRLLKNGGVLYFEINEAFGHETKLMLDEMGYKHVEVMRDMQAKDRMIRAIKV